VLIADEEEEDDDDEDADAGAVDNDSTAALISTFDGGAGCSLLPFPSLASFAASACFACFGATNLVNAFSGRNFAGDTKEIPWLMFELAGD